MTTQEEIQLANAFSYLHSFENMSEERSISDFNKQFPKYYEVVRDLCGQFVANRYKALCTESYNKLIAKHVSNKW